MKLHLPVIFIACSFLAGCQSGERDVSTLERYGALVIPTGEGPFANAAPVDAVLFDPAKRVITDDDFAAAFPSIRRLSPLRLDLHGQAVSDRCISLIYQLPDLRWVDLRNTKVSSDGLQ